MSDPPAGSALEVLAVATRLGLTSFGGPVAHLGYFREEYVVRRRWLDDATYADLIALCQTLPGPVSSQVGMAVGLLRAGVPGALAAWLGFTLPSAVAMALFASGVAWLGDGGWLQGLKAAALAVVAQAVWGMARLLAPDRPRGGLALGAAIVSLVWVTPLTQVALLVVAALAGWRLLPAGAPPPGSGLVVPVARRTGVAALGLFITLLAALPLLRQAADWWWLPLADSFYRAGSLVFGGGHVVLPLLQAEVVAAGWVSPERFVAGYGAAQAMPGPIFTFAAYLGALAAGSGGAAVALVTVFLPALLLVVGVLPFWQTLRVRPGVQRALRGVNAAVVGLLLAALYDPVWTTTVRGPADLALSLAAFGLLALAQAPPWLVVLLAGAAGALLRG